MERLLGPRARARARQDGLSNEEIARALSPLSPSFLGVFSVDAVPYLKVPARYVSLIVNLSRSRTPGSHFVALIYHPDRRHWHYLDPTGMPPFQQLFEKNFRHYLGNRPVLYNASPFQKGRSNFCGYYCIYFILLSDRLRSKPKSIVEKSLKSFRRDLDSDQHNDTAVLFNLRQLIKQIALDEK